MPIRSKKIRFKKWLWVTGGVIAGIFLLVVLCISPIAKYILEKYSVKWTGRQIKMSWAYVNPFTGFAHLSGLKIYEANSDSVFISAEGLSIGINMRKLFSKEYEITSITLDKPRGIAIQNSKTNFNFNDIIDHFSSPPDTTKPPGPPARFSILNIKIKHGIFALRDTLIGINYFIKDFNFEGPGYGWNIDSFPGKFSFEAGIGTGKINGRMNINVRNSDYRFSVEMQKVNLAIIEQYLKGITNYGTFSAYLDANVITKGNFKDAENSDTKGNFSVSDFHFGKTRKEDYLSFDTLAMTINEVNPKERLYHLGSITLTHPYFKFEKYDYLDNIETMFGESGANVKAVNGDQEHFNLIIELANYIEDLSRNFFESAYKIDKAAIKMADIKFNDFSASEEFSIDASPLTIKSDSIDKSHGNINIYLNSGLKPYGYGHITASIDPRDSNTFDLNYRFEKIPITNFNPYIISFTSYPFDRGTVEFNGTWHVRNGVIQSENHLLLLDPRVTKRVKNKDTRWIPMWLVMAFVRERSDVIDYQIPVTGNLKNPKFHLHDVFFGILNNIFVKPPTTPYRLEVRNLENEIEKSFAFKWQMRHSTMTDLQKNFIGKMADYMAKNPSESMVISPLLYAAKEKEYILFFEAKKKYYLFRHPEKVQNFSEADSEYVDKMSVKDSSFVHYLNKFLPQSPIFTIQDKCSNLISPALVDTRLNQLNKARENAFMAYFKEKGMGNRVKFNAPQNIIPYNGFSYFKIDYKGELPDYLVKDYRKIDELNTEVPREKYEKERDKIKTL
ncbi:MAG TPA: DUF748 domain-containing protein [Bacteroidia bacterium]|nr:DUF748 domain-containing protein [Bacteroidia bacterium]